MDKSQKGNNNGSYACEKVASFIIRGKMQIEITLRGLQNQSRAWTRSKRLARRPGRGGNGFRRRAREPAQPHRGGRGSIRH